MLVAAVAVALAVAVAVGVGVGLAAAAAADKNIDDNNHNKKCSGQIIATSHDRFTPNGGLVRKMGPLISGKSRWVKYYSIWPDYMLSIVHLILPDKEKVLSRGQGLNRYLVI